MAVPASTTNQDISMPGGSEHGPSVVSSAINIYIPAACSVKGVMVGCFMIVTVLFHGPWEPDFNPIRSRRRLSVNSLLELLNPCCWVSFPSFAQAGDHCTSRCFPGTRRWLLGGPSSC